MAFERSSIYKEKIFLLVNKIFMQMKLQLDFLGEYEIKLGEMVLFWGIFRFLGIVFLIFLCV